MRISPERHPLAVLRLIIGLTQKEVAALASCSTPTIQAVELGKLRLSEDLAMRVAAATGVDVGWLLDGDPKAKPKPGLTALGSGRGKGGYGREHYEFHRALLESRAADRQALKTAGKGNSKEAVSLTLPELKALLASSRARSIRSSDRRLMGEVKALLEQSAEHPNGEVIRWKIRSLVESLAGNAGSRSARRRKV